jgi:hypothetical protein
MLGLNIFFKTKIVIAYITANTIIKNITAQISKNINKIIIITTNAMPKSIIPILSYKGFQINCVCLIIALPFPAKR